MHAVNWDIFEIKDSGSKEDTIQQKKKRWGLCSRWSYSHLPMCYRPVLAEKIRYQVLWVQREGLKWKVNMHPYKFQRKEGLHVCVYTHTHIQAHTHTCS